MIICYAGTPGSCKTLEAVARLVSNLMSFDNRQKRYYESPKKYPEHVERIIYTNISGLDDQGCLEAISGLTGIPIHTYDNERWGLDRRLVYLPDNEIVRYWEHAAPNGLIFIDEVHLLVNNRNWDKPTNTDFNNASSIHRKQGYDLILISQDIDKIDKQTRGLIEWTYFYRKNNFFGRLIQTRFFRYTYTADNHSGKPLAVKQATMDKRLFACYKSYTAAAAKEIDFQSHINILKHPVFYAIPVVFGLCIYLFSKSSFSHGHLFPTPKGVTAPASAPGLPGPKKSVNPILERSSSAVKSDSIPMARLKPVGASLQTDVVQGRSSSSKKNVHQILTYDDRNKYNLYRIDGVMKTGSQIHIVVNGKPFKLPCKYIRNIEFNGGYCEGNALVFGTPKKQF